MANINRFTITGSSWSVSADQTTIGAFSLASTWEPLSIFVSELNALDTAGGGTLDLQGRQFAVPYSEASTDPFISIDNTNDITIKNGVVSGARIIEDNTWTETGGIYTAPFDHENKTYAINPMAYLIDPLSVVPPRLATWPSTVGSRTDLSPRTSNVDEWFYIRHTGKGPELEVNDVLTSGGDNVNGQDLEGFRINDTVMKNEWDAKFNQLSAEGTDVSDLMLFVYTTPNVVNTYRAVSWDSNTGVLMLTQDLTGANPVEYGSTFSSYVACCFVGAKSFITVDGQYSPDFGSNEIHYKPVKASAPAGVGLMSMNWLFRVYASGDAATVFKNMTICGAKKLFTAASRRELEFDGCYFFCCENGPNSFTRITDCEIDYWYGLGFGASVDSLTSDVIVQGNKLGPVSELRSAIDIRGSTVNSAQSNVVVKDNYITMPYSGHGNGITLYGNSWQKATVEHNIIHNCSRAVAYQPQSGVNSNATGLYRFANNLIVWTDNLYIAPGQSGYAFNGGNDYDLLGVVPAQEIEIYSNSLLVTQDVKDNSELANQITMMEVSNHRVGAKLANNVCSAVNCPADSEGETNVRHQHANNLQFRSQGRNPSGWSATDLPDIPDDDVMSHLASANSLAMAAPYSTLATDGQEIGVRWESIPTVAELQAGLSKTWYLSYPAEPVPDPTAALSVVLPGVDNRP